MYLLSIIIFIIFLISLIIYIKNNKHIVYGTHIIQKDDSSSKPEVMDKDLTHSLNILLTTTEKL